MNALTMVDRNGATNSAPNLDTVLSWRNARDVDARPARALHDVLHVEGEPSVLHEMNASMPCDDGLKHNKASCG